MKKYNKKRVKKTDPNSSRLVHKIYDLDEILGQPCQKNNNKIMKLNYKKNIMGRNWKKNFQKKTKKNHKSN